LLVEAETAKHELSRDSLATFILQGVTDRAGIPMNINLPFARQDFDRLIEPRVRSTLESCDRALRHARIEPGQLSDVVMVGGSSRVPLVVSLVEQHYGRRPRLIDPDLCVGVGAALKTASGPRVTRNLIVDRAIVTGRTADIGGRVLAGGPITSPVNQVIMLASDDGMLRRRERSTAAGNFQFQEIPLAEGDHGFTVQLLLGGEEIDSQRCLVSTGEDPPPDLPPVLAHNFYVNIKGGLEQIAALGTKIPHRTRFPLQTVNQGSTITVPIFESRTPIGQVSIENLPHDLPAGTTVDLDLVFGENWTIEAEVRVPSVNKAGTATIMMITHVMASWEELRRRYREVFAGWHEKRALASPQVRIEQGPVIDKLLAEVEELLNERRDRVKANHKLTEAETAVSTLPIVHGTVLQPPMSAFDKSLVELDGRCDALSRTDQQRAKEFRDSIPALRAAGLAAYEDENQQLWGRAVEAVRERIKAIDKILDDGRGGPVIKVSADQLQRELLGLIDRQRQAVREQDATTGGKYRDRAQDLLREANRIEENVGSIDVDDPSAEWKLQSIYTNQVAPWRGQAAEFCALSDVIDLERR
jgi:hypothetical protein